MTASSPYQTSALPHRRAQARIGSWLLALATLVIALALPGTAHAQALTIGLGEDLGLTERAIQLVALVTILSLAPSILIMVTSFTRIVVVLSILRTALGTQTAPPNTVIMALALFLTGFVMAPTMQTVYDESVRPLVEGSIEMEQAIERGIRPVHAFMREHVRDKDLELFMDMAREEAPVLAEDISLRTLVPAFMISELRRAFEIGFLLFVPFLIIDLVVASVLMSMGMMMLPPVIISLPFKLIFFVLVDGWGLVAGSLVQSFG